MNITGRNKLTVRENNKIFEAELDLDLKHEITELKKVKPLLFETSNIQVVKIGFVSCKGFVLSKNVEFTHEQAISNVNSVYANILEQAFRVLGENSEQLKSEVTYSYGILKSEFPLLVTIEMTLTECKLEFKVVTSGNSYEEVFEKARNLLKEFIGELQSQLEKK
jgi:hypothetical protein